MAEPLTSELRASVARSVLTSNLAVRRGERVIIEAWTHTLPWATAFAREARRLGAMPLVPYEDEAGYWDSVDEREFGVLGKAPAHEWGALAKTDVYIHMWGPGDRVRLNRLPPKTVDRLFAYNEGWYRAARKAGLRGVRLALGQPYPTLAEAYGVDLDTWNEQLARATVVAPAAIARSAATVSRSLGKAADVRLRNDDGTDLKLRLLGAAPRVTAARPVVGDPKRPYDMLSNLPGGLVRVALDTSVAEGTIVANRADYYDDGKATGAVFHFGAGRLTEAEFATGRERFDAGFRGGGPGRDRPGMLSVGLNPELLDTPQVEDIERGAILVSVGGNRQVGGKNASSFFGWAINAGARVEIDGRPLSLGR